MQAVIMAGGKGTRLLSLTKDKIPKPMALISGKSILERQIEQLKKYNITDIILVIGYLGDKIKNYFEDGSRFGVNISYIEESMPLGTAGALYFLQNIILDEDFILVFGDILFDIDFDRMKVFHQERQASITLFVHPNTHPFDSDLVILNEDKMVISFDSKLNQRNYWYDNCVNAGLYILKKEVTSFVTSIKKIDLEKDVITHFINVGTVYGYSSPEYIKDVGTVERITKAEEELQLGLVEKRNLKHFQRAIFLDRDGTINKINGLISNPDQFELEDSAVEAIRKINTSGFLAIVITNQPVVARGLCGIEDVIIIHNKMKTLLGNDGVILDDVLFCPHHPDKGYPEENPDYKIKCSCRKPCIGLIEECVERYNINLNESWFVGDTTIDIKTGINAGLKTALVLTGEAGKDQKFEVSPTIRVENILEAVNKILE